MASSSTQPGAASNKLILTPIMTLKGREVSRYYSNGEKRTHRVVISTCYFPDGKHMISGSWDKPIRRWDLRAGKEIEEEMREVCEQELLYAVGVSKDGRWLVTAGGTPDERPGDLKVCEIATGNVRKFQEYSRECKRNTCIDISADSTLLASGSSDGTVRIWELDTGKLVSGPFKMDKGGVGAVRFSQDSKKLAVKSIAARWLEVWGVETQKLDVRRVGKVREGIVSCAPVFWTTKDKTLVTVLDFNDDSRGQNTIYEFDALTLKTVGAPFETHTYVIASLALSFDCALLASSSLIGRNTGIKLWAFQSRQLLASFDIPKGPRLLLFSPNSPPELAYSTVSEIHICNIPPKIIASIWPNTNVAKNPRLVDLLNSDAIPRTVRRKPVISHVTYFAPRPQTLPTTQRRDFFHYLRIVLPSRTNGRRNDQHRDPLDFPATSPLPRKYSYSAQEATKTHSRMNPYENSRPPITQSSTTFKARLRDLRTGHALSPIVDTPLAQGKERNAAADAPPKNNDWIPYEDHVPSRPPSPNPDSQPRPLPTVQINTGEHGSSRLCGCF